MKTAHVSHGKDGFLLVYYQESRFRNFVRSTVFWTDTLVFRNRACHWLCFPVSNWAFKKEVELIRVPISDEQAKKGNPDFYEHCMELFGDDEE